ncbi:MAG: protein kinase [Archangium sp.]|nr:protein kinase [Archangium sp.]
MSTIPEDAGPASGGGELGVGDTLARYRITSQLGSGGMGEVFLAIDPQLDRQVALKVLRAGDRSPSAVTRLLREAKAMARVSHRNVVAVYDAGEFGEHPWVAMELIRGSTLRAWLEATPRSWHEILKVLIEAGQGLAAAHAASLVHRDFKPENVLVADSGRVVVSDFGIASGVTEDDVPLAAPSSTRLDERITVTGAQLGTPAYMAPEQHRGKTDARSDQYAFAVTAREALSGVKAMALATPLTPEQASAPPIDSKLDDVPLRVWRSLGRALSSDPAARYSSINELLAELTDALPKPRSYAWLAAIPLVVAAAGILFVSRQEQCDTGPAIFGPTWNRERQATLQNTFGEAVVTRLDAFAKDWLAMHREACEATVKGTQSPAMLDARMACLHRRQSDFIALVSRFEARGAEVKDKAPSAVRALGDVSECADTNALSGRPLVPEAQKAEAEELGTRLSALKALEDLGQYRELLEPGAKLAAETHEFNYAPLEAEVLRALGRAQSLTDATGEADKTLEQGLMVAERARDDRLRTRIYVQRGINFLGTGRYKEAGREFNSGLAVAERTGDQKLIHKVRGLQGDVAVAENRFADAEKLIREVVEFNEGVVPRDDRTLIGNLNTLASVLRATGRLDEAAKQWERAIELARHTFSPKDPGMALLLAEWSDTQALLGKLDAGQQAHDEAVRIFGEAVGPRSEAVAECHSKWARYLAYAGRLNEAREVIDLATAMRNESPEPQPMLLADSLVVSALVSMLERKDADAEKALIAAIPMLEKTIERNHPATVQTVIQLAVARSRGGKAKDALKLLDDARVRMDEGAKAGVATPIEVTLQFAIGMGEVKSTLSDCAGAKASLEQVKALVADPMANLATDKLGPNWTRMTETLARSCVAVRGVP